MLLEHSTNQHARPARTGWALAAIILATAFAVIASQMFPPATGYSQVIDDSTPEAEEEADDAESAPEAPDSIVVDGTPDDEEAAEEADEEEAEDTEAPSPSGASGEDPATEPGAPATLAHGLTYLTGDDLVWQVREVSLDATEDAEPVTAEASFLLQRDGESIIRNEVTGKRSLTSPGEAFFRAPGDAYTVFVNGDSATTWVVSLVEQGDVADDAFYESPLIDSAEEGSYDFSIVRYVLQPGDQADLPDAGGPAVIMASAGEVLVEDEAGLSLLADGQGQLLPAEGSVTNDGEDVAVYFVAMIGDAVSDETAGAPGDAEADVAETDVAEADEPDTEVTEAPEPAVEDVAPPEEEPVDPEPDPVATGLQTSIDVTAQEDIYLTIEADGLVIFDGNLAAGNSSGVAVGSTFTVYTTQPNATLFTNACGTQFYMGETTEEATFTLEADENSCPPA